MPLSSCNSDIHSLPFYELQNREFQELTKGSVRPSCSSSCTEVGSVLIFLQEGATDQSILGQP